MDKSQTERRRETQGKTERGMKVEVVMVGVQVALSHTSFYGYEYGSGLWVWCPNGFCFEMGEK